MLEALEDRRLMALISWTNRDSFDNEYGASTAAARNVIDQAIDHWENVIENFNYANVGQRNWSPHNYYQLEISVKDWQREGDDALARGGPDETDPSGKPWRGHITLDDNGSGSGWYFDPRPDDDFEFTNPTAAFAASGGPAGYDLYSTVLHEIGHTLGFSRIYGIDRFLSGRTFLFADGTTAMMDADKVHTDAVRHPDDLMNPTIGPNTRSTISDLDARILSQSYGYTVNLAATHQRSFITTFNPTTRQLTLHGDLDNTYDDMRLDVFDGGTIYASVNGRVKQISQNAVNSIVVLGKKGNDDIRIGGTAAGQPVNINAGSGTNYVYLSYSAQNLNTIQGDINVFEQGGRTHVNFLDESNPAARSFNITPDFVRFSGSNSLVRYFYNDVAQNIYGLVLRGGSGGNSYAINNLFSPTTIRVYAGTGNDTVNVGANAAMLNIDGVGGSDTVTIGRADGAGVSLIEGPVLVSNTNHFTDLIIDNSLSTLASTNMRIRAAEVLGIAPASISYDPRGIKSLTVKASTGFSNIGNTINVLDTPQNRAKNLVVNLSTGRNADTVNVLRTTSTLFIDGEQGLDTVNIGLDRRLQQVLGVVNVTNSDGFSAVNVDNSADTTRRTGILYNNGTHNVISGLNSADINLRHGTLRSLAILAGKGGNTFRIHDTPDSLAPDGMMTTLSTGADSDVVNVNGTTGALTLLAQGGENTITIGSTAAGMNAINGRILVNAGGGQNALIVDDRASNGDRDVTMDAAFGIGTISGYPATIFYATASTRSLEVNASRGDDVFTVVNTATPSTTINGGQGRDRFNVLAVAASANLAQVNINGGGDDDVVHIGDAANRLDSIQGKLNVNGGNGANTVFFHDEGNATAQTWNLFGVLMTRSGMYAINYQQFADVFINLGTAGNQVTLRDLSATRVTNVAGGDGRDSFTLLTNPAAHTLSVDGNGGEDILNIGQNNLTGILGIVSFNGGADEDALNITDRTGRTNKVYTLANGQIDVSTGPLEVHFADTRTVAINAGTGDDLFLMNTTAFDSAISIDGGRGKNTLDYSAINGDVGSGPVARYAGEGDANDTIGANHGVLVNGATFVEGKIGQAFSFDGIDDYVQIPNSEVLEASTISVEAWVNAMAPANDAYIVAKGASGDVASSYALYTGATGGLFFYISDGVAYVESPDAGAGVWDGNWHHIVGTFDGSMVRLYVDGLEIDAGTPTALQIGYALPTTNDLFLGSYQGAAAHPFVGSIDEVSVFNRALTRAEVQGRSSLEVANPVSFYKGDGNANDSNGGNHGTLVGDVGFVPSPFGQAFNFDGDGDYVDLGNDASLDLPESMSVAMWVRLDTLDNYKYFLADFAFGNISQGSLGTTTDGTVFAWFQSYTDGSIETLDGTTPIELNKWFHLAAVRDDDAKTVRLFVNGIEDASLSYAGKNVVALQGNKILGGVGPDFPADFMDGQLDEVGIYDRALTLAEIQALALVVDPGNPTGVVVNLPLGTATGLTGGIAQIHNVIGSAGDDILVGNGGNILDGGHGRDLLIAGASASTLLGGAGDDLLIAGTTIYDNDPVALAALHAVWTSSDNYTTRSAQLANDLLRDGTFTLNTRRSDVLGQGGLDLFFTLFDNLTDRTDDEQLFPR